MRIHGSVNPAAASASGFVPCRLAVQVDGGVGDQQHLALGAHDMRTQEIPPVDREVLALIDEDRVELTLETSLEHVAGLGDDLHRPRAPRRFVGDDARLCGVVDHPRAERVEARARHTSRVGSEFGASFDDELAQVVGEREVEAQHQHGLALCSKAGGTSGERKRLPTPRGAGDPADLGTTGIGGHPPSVVAQLHRGDGVVHHSVDDEPTADASRPMPPAPATSRDRRPGTASVARGRRATRRARRRSGHRDRRASEGPRLGAGAPRKHDDGSNRGAGFSGVTGKREELFVHGVAVTASHGQWLLGARRPLPVGIHDLDSAVAGTAMVGGTPVDDVDGEHPPQVVHQHQVGHVLAHLGSNMDRPVVAQRGERIEHRLGSVTERMLQFVEMFDGRSDDGHGIPRFGQADRLSSARVDRDLRTIHTAARGPVESDPRCQIRIGRRRPSRATGTPPWCRTTRVRAPPGTQRARRRGPRSGTAGAAPPRRAKRCRRSLWRAADEERPTARRRARARRAPRRGHRRSARSGVRAPRNGATRHSTPYSGWRGGSTSTTARRACVVRATRNGSMSRDVVGHVMAHDHVGGRGGAPDVGPATRDGHRPRTGRRSGACELVQHRRALVDTDHELGGRNQRHRRAAAPASHVEHRATTGREHGACDLGGGCGRVEGVVDHEHRRVVLPGRGRRLVENLLRDCPPLEPVGPSDGCLGDLLRWFGRIGRRCAGHDLDASSGSSCRTTPQGHS